MLRETEASHPFKQDEDCKTFGSRQCLSTRHGMSKWWVIDWRFPHKCLGKKKGEDLLFARLPDAFDTISCHGETRKLPLWHSGQLAQSLLCSAAVGALREALDCLQPLYADGEGQESM